MAEPENQQAPESTPEAAEPGRDERTVVVWRRTRRGLTLLLLGTGLIVLLWAGGLVTNLLADRPVVELGHVQVMVVHYVTLETLQARELVSTIVGTVALFAWIAVLVGYGLLGSTPDRSMSGSAVLALVLSILGFLVWPLAYLGTTMFLAYCYRGAKVTADHRLKLRSLGVLFLLILAVVLTAVAIVPTAPAHFDETWRIEFRDLDQTARAAIGVYLGVWLAWSIGFLFTIHRARFVLGRERVTLATTMPRPLPPGGNDE